MLPRIMESMPRLTEDAGVALERLDRCQLCGRQDDDVVTFVLWQECDVRDKPENRWLVTCRDGPCNQRVVDHPRLYVQQGWLDGAPGRWVLLCNDCELRQAVRCLHPDLKDNGGSGLLVKCEARSGFICGKGGCHKMQPVAWECTGKKKGTNT